MPAVHSAPSIIDSEKPEQTVVALDAESSSEPEVKAPVAKAVTLEQQMFSLWSMDVGSEVKACADAVRFGLNCLKLDATTLEILRAYNRPAKIELIGDPYSGSWLLTAVGPDSVKLSSGESTLELTYSEFNAAWDGQAEILWRRPDSYRSPLRPGAQSFQTVFWLQNALNKLGVVKGRIVTGGYYTQSLAELVKRYQRSIGLLDDGVLGPMTIMAINTQLLEVPVLHSKKINSK